MKPTLYRRTACYFAATLVGLATPVQAGDIVAILASTSAPYQEALGGFQAAFGQTIPTLVLSDQKLRLPAGTKIVIALGGKASIYPYPEDVAVIYAMAPGLIVHRPAGATIKILSVPPPPVLLTHYKELQPSLKTLAVFWNSDAGTFYMKGFIRDAAAAHVNVLSINLLNTSTLPDHLRAMHGKVDAVWLTPDPLIVNPSTFATLKEFARANHILFYAPTAALVEAGATASVAASPREMGRTAAQTAKRLLASETIDEVVYPESVDVVVNKSEMANVRQP